MNSELGSKGINPREELIKQNEELLKKILFFFIKVIQKNENQTLSKVSFLSQVNKKNYQK
jgi:hypothetical protein